MKQSDKDRWVRAAADAAEALSVLQDMQEELQGQYDGMSEKAQASEKGDLIMEACAIDIPGAIEIANEAENITLP